ncbi:MAG TPA: ABC transporter permease [Pyrinomonadaceae bacterium]|nr:ABC transporter permease [Chloracidobacterium sp.]MBP9108116.1 ABC transporter permease [Pyrinomonadaceae bacterium]MBK7802066.1 ABC transporter permease [Chloracidobacterium sp.]MBK9765800.1 ABC transporter permease [Chloracidobacterium sp.]MBL0239616.1 ABC transporter permease [Chloracidobacterium sp.]
MGDLLTPTFLLILLFSTIRLATPLIFAALGGMFSERAGVINIALEGLMLTGAFTAAVATYELNNPYLGFVCGLAAGAFVAAIFAVAVIKFEADQVVAGFAVSLLMLGLPAVISSRLYDSAGSTQQIAKQFLLPEYYNRVSIASILAFALVPVCWYVLYKTPFGLRIRAAGENPEAADAAGVNVIKLRYIAVILSGVLAAAGGAYLSIGQSSLFTRGMTAGRGYIALAALILAKWKPIPVLFACLFFGFTEALAIQMQGVIKMPSGEDVPVQFIQMIPYVLTIIVLAGFIGLSRAPKALGTPYRKES